MNSSLITSTRNGLFAIALTSLLATFGCAGGTGSATNPPALVSIQVASSNSNLIVGQTSQLTATGKYSDKTTKDLTGSVNWSTSPAGLATIATGGMLTAQSSGTVSITASMSSVSGSVSLAIAPKLVSIAITPATATIAASTKQQFTAIGTYSDNTTQPITGSVTWSSSKPAVATISDTSVTKGLALGVSAGTTTITATAGTITSTTPASLTVTSANATGLAISPNPATMAIEVSQQFTATATFSDGTTQDVTNVATWTSASSSIATVTVSGLVTARNIGSTNISAAFESVNTTTPLTVDASNLNSISIQAANNTSTMAQGTKIVITATGHFNNGSTNNLSTLVTWSSSDTSIAKFVSINQLSGLQPGAVTITAALGSISASIPFTVTNATIQSITVTPFNQTIPIGWHQPFTATGKFSDSSAQDISTSVVWSSDNSSVAAFGTPRSSTGVLDGLVPGSANISASFSFAGVSATGKAPLTVSSATLSSIAVTPTSSFLAPGSTLQINAQGTWTNGASQNLNVYSTWSSSDRSIATVGVAGNTTGQSAGTATITATLGTLSASSAVVVEGSNLVSIQIAPQNLKLPATIETQLKAKGTFSDGQQLDLTSAVTWTSSTPAVATVSNAADTVGVATGVTTGSTTISAAFAAQNATTTLTVTTATLNSIAVTPANQTISLGASQQFTAQGTFSDGSVVNIGLQAAWSSSDVAVATVRANGFASSASQGTTTIQASLDGVNGTAILTVQ